MLTDDLYILLGTTVFMPQTQLAAYPVLLPVYMMRYDWKVPTVPDRVALTCIIQAHSKDVREIQASPSYQLALTVCAGFGLLR